MIYLLMNNGGAGNQMFQYAYARKLQVLYGDRICIDLSKFDYKDSPVTKRPYIMDSFCLNNVEYDNKYLIHRTKCKVKQLLYKNKDSDYLARKGLFIPSTYTEDYPTGPCRTKNKYVKGLFQCHQPFDDIKDVLRKDFLLSNSPSEEIKSLLEKIQSENSVCIHWRRGDYLEKQYEHLNVCTNSYYINAIAYLQEILDNPVFYLFTNTEKDAVYLKNIVQLNYGIEYVNILLANYEHTDMDDFSLMRACKHFIISNSTFSWWAQYISDNLDKIVIAPSLWIKNNRMDARNLYEDNWVLFDVDGNRA